MGNLTYDQFVRSFDTYTEHEESICEKALNILQDNKISKKYKLILPLYRRFSISNNAILLQDYIEDPFWLYDAADQELMDRVRIHTRLKKGITDAYCKSHFGTSVLIMESGSQLNSISIKIEKDDYSYKMALTTSNSSSKKLAPAIDDGQKVANIFKTLHELTLDKVKVLIQPSSTNDIAPYNGINDIEFYNGIKAHFPLVENGKYVVYYFFPNNIRTKTKQRYGYGGIFVVSEHFLNKEEKSFFLNIAFLLGNRLAIKRFQQKIKAEAIKSAKAAIMSRNMSHNLGSHVMFYIKQKLQSVSKIVGSNVLHNIIPGDLGDIQTIQSKINANSDIELPFLVGLGRFINYLQERQDYIATVATDYIPARSTISFKDFIYDELKPDLRHKRHHPNGDGSDAGWQPKNLLLDYIAYSEGYTSSDKIEIKFGDFDGNTPTSLDGKKHFQALREFNVAVPGGVIGRQAIFSIVENIIRNAAKHSEHPTDGKLVIEMSLVTAEDIMNWGEKGTNMLRCQRTENSEESGSELAKLYADEKHKNKFHYLRIKVDMPNKSKDIDAVVEKLGESYIEEGGGMKDSSKGLKEMRISAAWLRGHSIDTGIPTEEPPVLAVYSEKYKETTDKETLSYILCIPKPCKVAFVVDKEHLTYVDANDKVASYMDLNPILEPLGCAVFGYDGETNELTKNEQSKESKYKISDIADYEIVCMLLDDTQESKKVNSILPYISSRHITTSKTTKEILDKLRDASDKKSTIDSIYEYWFKDKYPEPSRLMVADAKANADNKKGTSTLREDSSVVLSTTGSISAVENNCENSVVYSTHFKGLNHPNNVCDGDDQDKTENNEQAEIKVKTNAEYNQWLSNAACIESITGNNSTDRLIRQDEWTKEWKYKHLSAGLARVAIFDERIFSTFITKKAIITKEIVEAIKREHQDKAAKVLYKKYKGIIDDIDAVDIVNDPACIDQFIPEGKNDSHTYDIAQKNYERRIWAFNIEADKNLSDTINILGYDAKVGDNINWTDNNTNKPPVVIATFKNENKEYKIILSAEGQKIFPNGDSQIFDYITIHQGILDKIYNVFGIKDKQDEKYKVTNALHNRFSRLAISENATIKDSTDAADSKTAMAFLPNFIIHSGRSKPNEHDMPQHQPFVQFAAVDHAVKDCKYTLVELLATAHYEDNNNN